MAMSRMAAIPTIRFQRIAIHPYYAVRHFLQHYLQGFPNT
jgi:hypothetical protein